MTDDDDILAAEVALGVLDASDRAAAQARAAAEPAFAAAVDAWRERFAPLLDEVAPAAPSRDLWSRIEAAMGAVLPLVDRRLRAWRAAAIGASALAAVLLAALILRPTVMVPVPVPAQPTAPAPAALLIASIAGEGEAPMLVASYDPATRTLVITPAAMGADAARDRQLWAIAPGAAPRSLGLVRTAASERMQIPIVLEPGYTLAISIEPIGGSPTGQPTGPVVATGPLTRI